MDLNKLTFKSQEALQGAQQISQSLQQNVVDVLHLLYVLLGQQESVVPTIIDKLEINREELKKKIYKEIEKIPKVTGTPQFYLSSEMAAALAEAFKEAQSMGDEFVSTEHLFGALLKVASRAKKILEENNISSEKVSKIMKEVRGSQRVDSVLAGFQKSDLVILAARPSIGKTSLALDIARNVSVKHKVPVGIFSLEMSSDQLVDRMLSAQGHVDAWRIRTGRLVSNKEEDDFAKIGEAMGVLSEAPIFIDDSARANVMEMRTMARRLQAEHNLGLIIIDYLQLMEGRSSDNRVQEVSEISRSLKGLARELNIPVIALSQLNRSVESRSPQIPKLFDLRESGSIEQDADVVLFLYREDREKPDTPNKNVVQVIIAKHRNGPLGTANLYFNDAYASFSSLEKRHVS